VHIVGLDRARVARFGGEGRLAARGRRVLEVARLRRIARAIGGNDDVIEAEGQDELLRGVVLLLVSCHRPVAVGAKAFVEIAALTDANSVPGAPDTVASAGPGRAPLITTPPISVAGSDPAGTLSAP